MILQLSLISLAAAVAAWLTFLLWTSKARRLFAKLPGPPGYPLIGNSLDFFKNRDAVKDMTVLAKQYNGFFKLWLGGVRTLVITDPAHLKIFYSSNKMLDKASLYGCLTDALGENLFEAAGPRWKELRKMLTVHFTHTPVEILIKNFLYVKKFPLEEFRKKADGPFFPCVRALQVAATRSILMNIADEEVEEELETKLLDGMDEAMGIMFNRFYAIASYFTVFFRMTSDGRKVEKFMAETLQLFRERILRKMEQVKASKKSGVALPKMYAFTILDQYGPESVELLCREVMVLMLTGIDTSTGTIGFVLTVLGLFPEVQEKVYQEDQEVQKRLAGRELEIDDLQSYQYLEMVIKETLRLFPVGPFLGRKLDEDTYFGEYLVPAGTDVLAFQLYTNLNPDYFPDPLTFKEDRFSPENAKSVPPHAFNPFSNGPRGCPGMKYAYVSMKIFITAFVREFRIFSKYESLEEAMKQSKIDFTLKEKNGVPIRLERRSL